MTRTVHCVVLGREAPGLDSPPVPGAIGERIYRDVSREAWEGWLVRQQMIINEEQLVTAEPAAYERLVEHMRGYFFGEGELGGLPEGFRPGG